MKYLYCVFLIAAVCSAEPKTTTRRFQAASHAAVSGYNATASGGLVSWFFHAFDLGIIQGRPATYFVFNLSEYPAGDFSQYSNYAADGVVLGHSLITKGFTSASLSLPDLSTLPGIWRQAYTVVCQENVGCDSWEIPFPQHSLQGHWTVDTSTAMFGYKSETLSGTFERVIPVFNGEERTVISGTQRKTGTNFIGAYGGQALSGIQGELFLAQGSNLTVTSSKTGKQ